jgi:hypothetical protein
VNLVLTRTKTQGKRKPFKSPQAPLISITQEIATKCDVLKRFKKKLTQTKGSKTQIDPFFSHINHYHQLS